MCRLFKCTPGCTPGYMTLHPFVRYPPIRVNTGGCHAISVTNRWRAAGNPTDDEGPDNQP
jgi:hypothetical protein